MVNGRAGKIKFLERDGEGLVPEVSTLTESVDTFLDTSDLAFAAITRWEAHVDGGVDRAVQVGGLDIHLAEFPVLRCSESDYRTDGGETSDRSECFMEVDAVELGESLSNKTRTVLKNLPV